MRQAVLAVAALTAASLGLGTYLAAVDVAWNGPGPWAGPLVAGRDDVGRPGCRRNNFVDPERPLVRIGRNCP